MDIATAIGLIGGIATIASIIIIDGGNFMAYVDKDRKSTRLNSSHSTLSRMPSSA